MCGSHNKRILMHWLLALDKLGLLRLMLLFDLRSFSDATPTCLRFSVVGQVQVHLSALDRLLLRD